MSGNVRLDMSEFDEEIKKFEAEERAELEEEKRAARVAIARARTENPMGPLPTQSPDSMKLQQIVKDNYRKKFKMDPKQEFQARKARLKAKRLAKRGEDYNDRQSHKLQRTIKHKKQQSSRKKAY